MSPTSTPDVDARVLALVQAQAALRRQATAGATAIAAAAAQGFNGWYDTSRITEWAATLALVIETWQRSLASTTDAYLARVLTVVAGARVAPVGAVDVTALRTGITHAGAYARAADVYRWQQSRFDDFTRELVDATTPQVYDLSDPIAAAVQRVVKVADMDAQLAARAQTQQVMTSAHEQGLVTGYRRVIHPELSRGGTCGLCIAAADRLYGAREPLPIHARCECTTLPVLEHMDPGSAINASDLRRLYRDAGGTGREKLKRTRYQIDEHGELGAVLTPAGTQFRSKGQAARDTNRARAAKTDAEKAAEVRRIRDSLAEALPKAQTLAGDDPKAWGDYLHKLEDRIADLDHQLAA